jgi:tRNA (mo5U34)-methyltransferase
LITDTLSPSELRDLVEGREWYHTMELAPGIVTPGFFDHRPILAQLPLPASLTGLRCLDVATFDGFWAFEMERRGAAEVVGVDILDPFGWDWPVDAPAAVIDALERRKQGGAGFRLAARALGSRVEHREVSVYDLDPEVHGQFDVVYLGSLLMHLRDPVRALERVRSVCRGRLLLVDNVDLFTSLLFPRSPLARLDGRGRPWWWKANVAGLRRMVEAAGFTVERGPRLVFLPPGPELTVKPLRAGMALSREGRDEILRRQKGDPHAWLVGRP